MNDTPSSVQVEFDVSGRPFSAIVLDRAGGGFVATVPGTDAVGRGVTIDEAVESAKANLIELAEQARRDREARTTVDGAEATIVFDGETGAPAELQIPREKLTLVEARRRLDARKEAAAKEHAALALQKERTKTADAEVAYALENLLAAVDREVELELPLDEEDAA